jgi:hypothetical protein
MSLDQHRHRGKAPQGEGQTEVVGRVAANQSADLPLLLASRNRPVPGAGPNGQSGPALLGEAAADIEDAGSGQAHLGRDGLMPQAALAQADDLPALLLGCSWQLAHSDMLHPYKLDRSAAELKITQAGSIIAFPFKVGISGGSLIGGTAVKGPGLAAMLYTAIVMAEVTLDVATLICKSQTLRAAESVSAFAN